MGCERARRDDGTYRDNMDDTELSPFLRETDSPFGLLSVFLHTLKKRPVFGKIRVTSVKKSFSRVVK